MQKFHVNIKNCKDIETRKYSHETEDHLKFKKELLLSFLLYFNAQIKKYCTIVTDWQIK